MKAKPSAASRTIQTSLVLPSDTNQHGTIFGGTMMSYIDEVAAIAAMKHCRTTVVTASIDSIDFLSPVKMGHSLCIEAFVTATGTTSMEDARRQIDAGLKQLAVAKATAGGARG